MTKQIQRVTYEHPALGPLNVERLQSMDVRLRFAKQVRELVGVAYADEFESERAPQDVRLPRGLISHGFLSDLPEKVEAQRDRMEAALALGGAYWYVRFARPDGPDPDKQLEGMVKTSPSRATAMQKLHVASPNCYVNDIMVRPSTRQEPGLQCVGVGSALLYTALTQDYKPSATVVADTYKIGRTGSRFFANADFETMPDIVPPATVFNGGEVDEIHLPMDRQEAQLSAVAERLIARFDWLQTAEVTYTA